MNATALAQDSEAITDGTFGAMQCFRDEFCGFVTCHGEKDSVVIFGPRLSGTQTSFLRTLLTKSKLGCPTPNRVRLPARMPPKKLAHRFSLPFPPCLIAFSKDLVVLWAPGRALIELSIRRLLEPANLSPQFRSSEAWFVFQNSFDGVVRTSPATLCAFAQDSVDLFRREKPEGIATRCTSPTVYHRAKHLALFNREPIGDP